MINNTWTNKVATLVNVIRIKDELFALSVKSSAGLLFLSKLRKNSIEANTLVIEHFTSMALPWLY